ncbi:hypothetical protein Vretimale_4469 [Volvox reticuliferus]|uniref:Uncharacterized protein n=4 Tax=Volvox reticuliferus TaxID=1737510 RepID=A0A8J4DGK2_9CHLO|nr:hypothetical protein Vretimale_4469 [Volvox reticuliferus]
MEVLTARWDGLQRAAARQRRAGRAQRQQTPAQPQAPAEQAPAAAAGAPSAASGVSGPDSTAAAPNPLDEFRPVAQLINQLFNSWETVLQVPAEPSRAEGDGEGSEGDNTDEDGAKNRQEGDEAEGRQRSRRGEEANRRAAVDESMSAMVRTMMPAMLSSICYNVAQSILPTLMAAAESLDGQQLAMAVLQALVSRLDGVASTVLANWSRISSGLEEIESASEGTSVGQLMSQMVRLAASIVTDAPPVVPGPPPAPGDAAARPPAAQSPTPPQASASGPAPAAAATSWQAQLIAPPAASQAPSSSVTPVTEASTSFGAAQSPSNEVALSKPPAEVAATAAAASVPAAPDEAPWPSATAITGAEAGAKAAESTCSDAGASSTSAAATVAAAAAGPSLAPKGLGLSLRPPATKKKPAAAPAALVARTAAEAPTGSGLSPGPAASTFPAGTCAGAGSGGPDPKAAQTANTNVEQQAGGRQAVGANRLVAAQGPGVGVGSGGRGAGDAAADPLDGLMEMMEHVLGTLDQREAGGSGSAGDGGRAGSGGGAAAGGGFGNILQTAQKIISDPAMQPMLDNVVNAVLGGGGGRPGAAGGGLGGLLGSLLGGLPPAPSASSGSARSASSATERAGYEVLLEVLGPEEGPRWRELIERDVEEMQQHVQIAPEEHSDNYRRGVPTRRAGLLSTMAGAEKNLSGEDDDEYDGIEDDPEGHNAG